MPEKPDWEKHAVIAAYVVGIPLIFLGILTFARPPDPAHPMSFDFLSKSIVLPPWLALFVLVVVVAVTALVARRKQSMPVVQPSPMTSAIDTTALFEIHVPTLDKRPPPERDVKCPAKLRFSLKNVGTKPVHVQPLNWLMGPENVSLQCGAAPYPGQIYKPGMQEVGYFYQMENHQGSWQQNLWQMKGAGNKDHDERRDILVQPGWTFRVWIGMNPCVPDDVLNYRLTVNKLGVLILPLLINGEAAEWRAEF